MKITITAKGKFKYLKEPENTIDIEIDLIKLNDDEKTLNEVITEAFEDLNAKGCTCNFNESQNYCECDGYGYEYEYEILGFFELEE